MTSALFSMRTLILEQRERTRKSSKADIERFIQESELKITSLESQISALVALRDRERDCVAALRHFISPIHTLPVELLLEIFELTIHAQSHVRDVLRISQVCSDWRQVAHNTPRLWTGEMQINLRERIQDGAREQIYVENLKTWLLRSAPLSIPITLVLDSGSSKNLILDEVLGTAPRWRSLTLINWDRGISPSFISRLAETELNNLEELGPLTFLIDVDLAALSSFTTVPRLRKLEIEIESNVLPTFVPWAQLTHLTFISGFPIDILAHCPNLIQATVHTAAWTVLPDARQTTSTLSHLRTLDLHFLYGQHFVPFTDSLSAPALEELYLDFSILETDRLFWTSAHFTAFQLRAPNITRLGFEDSLLTVDDLMIAIRHAPFLTHLKLTSCYACFDDTLISALRYEAGATPLAPNLHYLRLRAIGINDNLTETKLADMIASRWFTDAELASRPVPPEVARWTCVALDYNFNRKLFANILPSDVLET